MARVRLGVMQIFGLYAPQWRLAIEAAAREKGWSYHEFWGGEPPIIDPDSDCVIVCADVTDRPLEVSSWLVITSPPEEAVNALIEHGLDRREAVHHASRRFAHASALVQSGATAAHSYDLAIDVPVLGRVTLAEQARPPVECDASELDFYRQLPPARGVAFPVRRSQLNFPIYRPTDDGTPRISLLGRRRLLFNGPTTVMAPGTWRLNATFSIDCDQPVHLLLGWGNEVSLEKLEESALRAGRYEISLSNFWMQPGTADFTCMLMTPVLEGWLELESCTVTFEGP